MKVWMKPSCVPFQILMPAEKRKLGDLLHCHQV
ncbi:rCG55103 [Rattus norvegicus]|uniref:RCG55103 n=1 Tax=Rattus norvegicus TaxID=10116 RepID=A6IIB8_RAT|nr:rCG55103 [Rattus norvegicus]